jgi:hypothetical protein
VPRPGVRHRVVRSRGSAASGVRRPAAPGRRLAGLVVRLLVVRLLVVRLLVVRLLVVRQPGAPGRLAAIADVAGAASARRERRAATKAA